MAQLHHIEQRLIEIGYQIVAVSPDRPEALAPTGEKQEFRYTLISDSAMVAARSFGIAFRVDNATQKKYRKYGIDLEEVSGETHHLLPVPSVFIIGRDGTIMFSYVNPDYKVRLDPGVILAVAESLRPTEP